MYKREAITDSNVGPVLSLLTWIMEASVIIAVGIKFVLSSVMHAKRLKEDIALSLATVSARYHFSASNTDWMISDVQYWILYLDLACCA